MTGVPGCPVKVTSSSGDVVCMEAQRAADEAVKKTFAIMGVDINCPKEVSEFQDGLLFGRKMNTIANKSIITLVIVALGASVTYIVRAALTKV